MKKTNWNLKKEKKIQKKTKIFQRTWKNKKKKRSKIVSWNLKNLKKTEFSKAKKKNPESDWSKHY